jgi:hypothetical protein
MSLSDHLRRIADGPVDAIDAEHLMQAATQIENLLNVVEVAQWARNSLERIADDSWYGDARDFKRSLEGIFLDFDEALKRAGSSMPEHIRRSKTREPLNE